jgi:hypothetical protein
MLILTISTVIVTAITIKWKKVVMITAAIIKWKNMVVTTGATK